MIFLGAGPPPGGEGFSTAGMGNPPGQWRGPLPSFVLTRHRAVRQGWVWGLCWHNLPREGRGCREVGIGKTRALGGERPMRTAAAGLLLLGNGRDPEALGE